MTWILNLIIILIIIGISCSNNDIEINNVKSFLQGEIDGKVDSTDFTTLEGIVGGIGTAQGIADGAHFLLIILLMRLGKQTKILIILINLYK